MDQTTLLTNYQQSLTQAGLEADQALIYEVLLKNGPLPAGKIHQKTPLKRGLVYKRLDELAELGLVTKHEEPGKVAVFEPAHPLKLKEMAEKKEEQAKSAQIALTGILDKLNLDYNLISGKPGVRMYEGLNGVKQVLENTLIGNPNREIRTFSDLGQYLKYLKDWNRDYYAPKRKRLRIKQRGIVPNDPQAVEYMKGYQANEITQALMIDHNLYNFKTETAMYSNKVSFVTFAENGAHVGIIIENPEIFRTMTAVFDYIWDITKKYHAEIMPDPHAQTLAPPHTSAQTATTLPDSPTPDTPKASPA